MLNKPVEVLSSSAKNSTEKNGQNNAAGIIEMTIKKIFGLIFGSIFFNFFPVSMVWTALLKENFLF